jgi:hypothetical protein
MKVSFTCTINDYAAANRLHRRPEKGRRAGWGERLLFLWIVLALIVLMLALAVAAAFMRASSGAPQATRGEAAIAWVVETAAAWVPWLVIFGVVWFFFSGVITPRMRRPLLRLTLLLASMPLLIRLLDLALDGPTPPALPTLPAPAAAPVPQDAQSPWRTLLPYGIVMVGVWVFAFRYLRGLLRSAWAAQPHLALPQTLEATDERILLSDPTSAHDYRWSAFTKWRESNELFLIYISEMFFHMVPKRAFETPAELEAFRQLLEGHVHSADAAPRGFSVQPVTAAVTAAGAVTTGARAG